MIHSVIEAGQAANNFFYKSQRMNTRGLDNVHRNQGFDYILDLLRVMTAVKINRLDLISKLNSFGTNRIFMRETGRMRALKQAINDIFYYPTLSPY